MKIKFVYCLALVLLCAQAPGFRITQTVKATVAASRQTTVTSTASTLRIVDRPDGADVGTTIVNSSDAKTDCKLSGAPFSGILQGTVNGRQLFQPESCLQLSDKPAVQAPIVLQVKPLNQPKIVVVLYRTPAVVTNEIGTLPVSHVPSAATVPASAAAIVLATMILMGVIVRKAVASLFRTNVFYHQFAFQNTVMRC